MDDEEVTTTAAVQDRMRDAGGKCFSSWQNMMKSAISSETEERGSLAAHSAANWGGSGKKRRG